MTLKYLNSNIDCADGIVQDPQCKNVQRYHGHVNKKYGLQSCIYPELNNQSILSGSEDHKVDLKVYCNNSSDICDSYLSLCDLNIFEHYLFKVYIWDAQGCDESNSSAVLEGHDGAIQKSSPFACHFQHRC